MKPPPFSWAQPRTLDEALDELAEHGDDAKVIAGGQSLIPMLNLRVAQPARLIDVTRVAGLAGVRRRGDALHIGATTRQSALKRSAIASVSWPVLPAALEHVAHEQIRNRGTVGGSIAHADPAAELPVLMTALQATVVAHSRARGERRIAAEDFFLTHLTTVLEPDELLTSVVIPLLPTRSAAGFAEYARRHGDFALAGAAAVLEVDDLDVVRAARIVVLGAGGTPWRATEAETTLIGQAMHPTVVAAAGTAASDQARPTGDLHGSAPYRARLIGRVVRDALADAAARLPTACATAAA